MVNFFVFEACYERTFFHIPYFFFFNSEPNLWSSATHLIRRQRFSTIKLKWRSWGLETLPDDEPQPIVISQLCSKGTVFLKILIMFYINFQKLPIFFSCDKLVLKGSQAVVSVVSC